MSIYNDFKISLTMFVLSLFTLVLTVSPLENSGGEKEALEGYGEAPSDIASVSKFITEFHRQFEDESLTMARTEFSSNGLLSEVPASYGREIIKIKVATQGSNEKITLDKNNTSSVKCNEERKHGSLTVEIVNSTRLATVLMPDPTVTSRHMPGDCVVVLFYSRTCPFSCLAAPHFNALPRAFPNIKMVAINAIQHQSFNTQFGIAGVPTVMLFHNGRPAAKFNDSVYTLEMFARFIIQFTGMKGVDKMFVTSGDFGGPVPSTLAKESDWLLTLSWTVIAIALSVAISRSPGWSWIAETVASAWREAQAHHDHNY